MAKAYVPASNVTQNLVNADKKPIPPYPDEKVKFAGYAKKQIGYDEFQLKPQEIFNYTLEVGTLSNQAISNSVGLPLANSGKKLFIKSVQLNFSIGTFVTSSYFRISNGNKQLWKFGPLRSDAHGFVFDTPLEISEDVTGVTPSGLTFGYSTGASGVINGFLVNLQGWYE